MGKVKKLLLIQPHSDDLLFSCSHLLFDDSFEKQVLTIENNPKRIKEDKELYSFLSIKFNHLDVPFDDQSYYGYHKAYKEVTVEDSYNYLLEFFNKQILDDIECQLREFLNRFFKENKKNDVVVVAPWGVGHPFHIFVRDLIEKILSDVTIWYYREFPHSYKKRSKIQVEKQQNEYQLLHSMPIESFEDIKWSLSKKFYKTQSGLLFFEQGYIKKKLPEELYIQQN